MDIQRLRYLLNKHSTAAITPEEKQELLLFLQNNDNHLELQTLIDEGWIQSVSDRELPFTNEASEKMLSRLMHRINNESIKDTQKDVRDIRVYRNWIWAAAVLLIAVGGTLVYRMQHNRNKTTIAQTTASAPPILPGRDGAMLTLADGSTMVLDSLQDGTIATQGSTAVILENGLVSYHGSINDSKNIPFNTISTPRGRQFKLRLSDGTQVWLNAASSISYPLQFSGEKREVKITGEVYFDVMTDKNNPFIVKKGNMSVEVTGTQFNVNTYEDESSERITLLEGIVDVKNEVSQQRLKPGQQASINHEGEINLNTNVDTDAVVAWKNGYFSFNNTYLQSLMRVLTRWYDVEVEYEGEIPNMKFGGEISRNTPLEDVLNILEESKVHFRIEQKTVPFISRKIIVSP